VLAELQLIGRDKYAGGNLDCIASETISIVVIPLPDGDVSGTAYDFLSVL
jgi:hypothetical protein